MDSGNTQKLIRSSQGLRQISSHSLVLLLLWALVSPEAGAYVSIRSSNGVAARWSQGSNITVRSNEKNSSGMSGADIFTVFTNSLNRWKQAAASGFGFTFFQGTDTSRYPVFPNVTTDSEIFFTSQTSSNFQIQCGTIAITQIYFEQGNGNAQRFDIRFNDNCYQFTNTASDTGVGNRIFLGDVATHELGHGLGLDHSQNLQSAMVYTAANGMSKPSCDDQAAMTDLFNPGAAPSNITGRVQTSTGASVYGAHVNAISLERGEVLASTISMSDGSFRIGGLEAGTYSIMVEPFYPGSGSLGPFYAAINTNTCSGSKFERTFLTAGNKLQTITLGQSQSQSTGNITVNCTTPQSINAGQEGSFASAPILASTPLDAAIATVGSFSSGYTQYFKLRNQPGHIQVSALSYSLWSFADVRVDLLNTSGQLIAQTTTPNVIQDFSTTFTNFDAKVEADIVGTQDVIVRVSYYSMVSVSEFPSGSTGMGSTPYYMITASRGFNPANAIYSTAARCDAADSFGAYPRLGDPGQVGGSGGGGETKKSGGCGMIERADRDRDGTGMDGMVRFANFAGLIALILVARRRLIRVSASQ